MRRGSAAAAKCGRDPLEEVAPAHALLLRAITVTGRPSFLDALREVSPEPVREMRGQRRDDDLVDLALLDGALDRRKRIRLRDQAIDGSASRLA